MKTNLTFALLVSFVFVANAQENTSAVGARAFAMGNANVAVVDIWSVNNNHATLSKLEYPEIAVMYKNNFGLSELSLSAISAAIPTNFGTFGASFANFGFSEYRENKATVAFAKRLWKMFSLSAAINYYSLKFESEYKSASSVTGEVGMFADFSDEFCVGFHVSNVTQSSFDFETKNKLATRYALGVAYKPTTSFLLCADFEYNNETDFVFRGGIEYYILSAVCVRAGAATEPTLFTLGAGYRWRQFNFDVAYAYHNVLGNITSASVLYKFKKR